MTTRGPHSWLATHAPVPGLSVPLLPIRLPMAFSLLVMALLLAPGVARADNPSGGRNAPEHFDTQPVLLVSIDGYRRDFPELYPTPAITRLVREGMRAEALVPVWPTLTFPNHYSLVTGLSPAQHGIVGNDFPDGDRWYALRDRSAVEDGSYYGGEPLWVAAERAGMVAASFFWVGSEAAVQGVRPTHWRRYDGDVPNTERVDQVLRWLAEPPETRPRFITLYFEDVDSWGHWQGLGLPRFLAALQDVDRALGQLLDGLDALPQGDEVTLALVSDHGLMAYHDEPPLVLEDHLYLDGLTLVDKGTAVYAWQDEPDPAAARHLAETVNTIWVHGRAWTRDSAPASWGLDENPRMPHLVFQADAGYAVLSRHLRANTLNEGDHGWIPEAPQMQGVFIARGPGIAPGSREAALSVLDVAPWLRARLGLE